MAEITDAGVLRTSLAEYRERLEEIFREVFTRDLDLSPETPQGQLIGSLATVLADVDDAIVALANSFSVQRASGAALDDLVSLLGVYRRSASYSSVEATVTGIAGTMLPAGTHAKTAAGKIFISTSAATIPTSGAVSVTFRAVEPGAIPVPAGALVERVDAIGGWQGVSNSAAGIVGAARESEQQLRERYSLTLAHNAVGSPEAIRAGLLDVDEVERVSTTVNPRAMSVTVRGVSIAPHSIACVVGGSASDAVIAAAIAERLNVGAGTSGSTSVTHTLGSGSTIPIAFTRESVVAITITMSISLASGFPSDGLVNIQEAFFEYVSGLGIGDVLDRNRMLAGAFAVPGWSVGMLTIARKTGLSGVEAETDLGLEERVTITKADVALTVT